MVAPSQRNELTLDLGGQSYTLRANFEAIAGIERDTGKSIIELGSSYREGTIKLTEIATIVFHGLTAAAAGKDVLTRSQIGEFLAEKGAVMAMAETLAFPAVAMNGVSLGKPQPSQKGRN